MTAIPSIEDIVVTILAPLEVFRWDVCAKHKNNYTSFFPFVNLNLFFLFLDVSCGTSSVLRTSIWITVVSSERCGTSLWLLWTLMTKRCWSRWWTRRTGFETGRARRAGNGATVCRYDDPFCPLSKILSYVYVEIYLFKMYNFIWYYFIVIYHFLYQMLRLLFALHCSNSIPLNGCFCVFLSNRSKKDTKVLIEDTDDEAFSWTHISLSSTSLDLLSVPHRAASTHLILNTHALHDTIQRQI